MVAALINDKGSVALVNKVDGRPIEILRYEPAHFTVDYSGDGRLEPSFRINNVPVSADDVVHLRSPFACCPLSLAADAIGVTKLMEGHAGRLFRDGARPSGVLALKDRTSPDALKRIREALQLAHGGGKSGGTAIVEGGAEYTQLTLKSTDAQFLEIAQIPDHRDRPRLPRATVHALRAGPRDLVQLRADGQGVPDLLAGTVAARASRVPCAGLCSRRTSGASTGSCSIATTSPAPASPSGRRRSLRSSPRGC